MRSACIESLTMLSIEERIEAATVAPAHTRDIPMSRAAEVAAVRRVLATRLRTARRPPGRMILVASPRTATTGLARTGERTSSPMTRAPAPAPRTAERCVRPSVVHTAVTPAAPAAASTAPTAPRSLSGLSREPEVARMASTGAVRAASLAGSRAPATVTSTPVMSETVMIRVVIGIPPPGRGMPPASSITMSRRVRPVPARTPSADPMMPMTTAWKITTAKTDETEAPIARSRANSLTRWRTLIAKVFMMMKEPTNMARTTKTSRKVCT